MLLLALGGKHVVVILLFYYIILHIMYLELLSQFQLSQDL